MSKKKQSERSSKSLIQERIAESSLRVNVLILVVTIAMLILTVLGVHRQFSTTSDAPGAAQSPLTVTSAAIPIHSPRQAATSVPLTDSALASSTVYEANKELGVAFLDVSKSWTNGKFKFWCPSMIDNLEREREARRTLYQPKNGRIVADHEFDFQSVARIDNNWQVVETGSWTFEYDLDPNAHLPFRPSPQFENLTYIYTVLQTGQEFCILRLVRTKP